MRFHFLGTGGATITPRPACSCHLCCEARAKGLPYSRWGPALFEETARLLFDTPEEIALELLRANAPPVEHLFYTHWHPDHTSGMRVLEHLNVDWRAPRCSRALRTTPVYLPRQVAHDFERFLGLRQRLAYYEHLGIAAAREVADGEWLAIGHLRIQPIPMANPSLYAYLLVEDSRRVLLAVDDTYGWRPPTHLHGVDLVVLETGWFERGVDGQLLVPPDHPVRGSEASFEETLAILDALGPRQAVLTHVEHMNARSYDDFVAIGREIDRHRVTFAYDGLVVAV